MMRNYASIIEGSGSDRLRKPGFKIETFVEVSLKMLENTQKRKNLTPLGHCFSAFTRRVPLEADEG
jgi:hypothetical protein